MMLLLFEFFVNFLMSWMALFFPGKLSPNSWSPKIRRKTAKTNHISWRNRKIPSAIHKDLKSMCPPLKNRKYHFFALLFCLRILGKLEAYFSRFSELKMTHWKLHLKLNWNSKMKSIKKYKKGTQKILEKNLEKNA